MQRGLGLLCVIAVLLAASSAVHGNPNFGAISEGLQLPSFGRLSSLARDDGPSYGTATYGNCTDATSCGKEWLLKVYEGPNCQGSFNYVKASNTSGTPVCQSDISDGVKSVVTMCDKSLYDIGFFGLKLFTDSAACTGPHGILTGIRLGSCYNPDTQVLNSTFSYAAYCSFTDASTSTPSSTYPASGGAPIPSTTPCANGAPACDIVPHSTEFTGSATCGGPNNITEVIFPNATADTCYELEGANVKVSCFKEGVMMIGTYGKNCETSTLSSAMAYRTEFCYNLGGSASSVVFHCKYTPPAPSSASVTTTSIVLAMVAMILAALAL